MTDDGKEQKWPAKLRRVLTFVGFCLYPHLWLLGYVYFQCFLSSICPSLGIDIFAPAMVQARVEAMFLTGAFTAVLILCLNGYLRRLFPVVLLIWFFSINHIYLTVVLTKPELEFGCSRPINTRLASLSCHQGVGCYLPSVCPGQLNTVITSYLRSKGEEDRYAGVFPGFVCRLVLGETRETLRSYRVEAEKGSDTKLYCTQEMMANTQVVPLSHEQVERLEAALAALKSQESEVELVPSPENIFLEYQIAGQYFYMQNSGKGKLAEIRNMLMAMAK